MNKTAVAIAALVIVAVFSVYAFFSLSTQKPVVFEEIVPVSAIYYISTSNLNKNILDLKSSRFFLKFSETSLYKQHIGPAWEKLYSKTPFLKDFMDKDIAIAVLSLGQAGNLQESKKFGADNIGSFLIFIRIDKNKFPQIKRSVAETFAPQYKGKTISSSYLGIKISSFQEAGRVKIHYAILSDTVVISNNLQDMQKSIDLFKNKSTRAIAKNANFKQAIARIKKDSLLWGYKNSENYYADYFRQIQETTDAKAEPAILQMKTIMSFMEAFKDVSFYIDYDKQQKAFVAKNYTIIDPLKDDSGFLDIIARDQALNPKIFSLIPRDTIGYYAFNQDLVKFWDFWMNFFTSFSDNLIQMNSNSGRPNAGFSPGAAIKSAESFLGINLKNDLIALLGDDFSMVLEGLDELEVPVSVPSFEPNMPPQQVSQRILFPKLYFFCGVKDNAKLDKVMEQMFQKIADNINTQAKETQPAAKQNDKAMVTVSAEDYKDVTIRYFAFQGFPVNPSYCILDKYLVFAISRDLAKQIIDTYKSEGGSFNDNAEFASIKESLPKEYSSISFLDFAGLMKSITRSAMFKNLHTSLEASPNPNFSSNDLDLILSALGSLKKFAVTIHKIPGEDILESQAVLTIDE